MDSLPRSRGALEPNRSKTLRLLTYNVNWGYCLSGLATQACWTILKAIQSAGADVVCLQETHDGWETFLTKELASTYPHMLWRHHVIRAVTHHLKEGSSAGGLAILSKYPITEVFYGQPMVSGSFFPGVLVAVATPSGLVTIMNVHLRPPISDQHRPSLLALINTGQIRKAEVKCFVEEMCPGEPDVICGDFNEGHTGAAVGWLKSYARGYRDALWEYNETAITWKWPLKMGLCLKGTYDHVMYHRHRLRALGCRVLSEYELVSDHMPVVAEFQFTGQSSWVNVAFAGDQVIDTSLCEDDPGMPSRLSSGLAQSSITPPQPSSAGADYSRDSRVFFSGDDIRPRRNTPREFTPGAGKRDGWDREGHDGPPSPVMRMHSCPNMGTWDDEDTLVSFAVHVTKSTSALGIRWLGSMGRCLSDHALNTRLDRPTSFILDGEGLMGSERPQDIINTTYPINRRHSLTCVQRPPDGLPPPSPLLSPRTQAMTKSRFIFDPSPWASRPPELPIVFSGAPRMEEMMVASNASLVGSRILPAPLSHHSQRPTIPTVIGDEGEISISLDPTSDSSMQPPMLEPLVSGMLIVQSETSPGHIRRASEPPVSPNRSRSHEGALQKAKLSGQSAAELPRHTTSEGGANENFKHGHQPIPAHTMSLPTSHGQKTKSHKGGFKAFRLNFLRKKSGSGTADLGTPPLNMTNCEGGEEDLVFGDAVMVDLPTGSLPNTVSGGTKHLAKTPGGGTDDLAKETVTENMPLGKTKPPTM